MTPEPTKVTPNADALTAGATVLGLTRTRVNGPAPTRNRAVPGSSPGAGTRQQAINVGPKFGRTTARNAGSGSDMEKYIVVRSNDLTSLATAYAQSDLSMPSAAD